MESDIRNTTQASLSHQHNTKGVCAQLFICLKINSGASIAQKAFFWFHGESMLHKSTIQQLGELKQFW